MASGRPCKNPLKIAFHLLPLIPSHASVDGDEAEAELAIANESPSDKPAYFPNKNRAHLL